MHGRPTGSIMEPIDTLICARWIAPVSPFATVLEDHAIAVDAGRIVDLVETEQAERRYQPRVRHDLARSILIPGLVNAHTHAAMSLFKGLADDLPLMTWLNQHIWPAEQRWVSNAFVRDGTRLAIAEMIRGGTTCFNDMYFYPDEVARAASDAGMRAVAGLILIDFPTVWAGDADEYLSKGLEVHDRYRDDPLITTAFAPHAPYTVSDAPLERVRTLADELDIPVHIHLHETASEVSDSQSATGERPISRLDRLGLLCDRLIAVHMTQLERSEIEQVADRGVHVVHCPESNLKLASGFCPVAELLAAGANVALGTDGAASNNDLSMLGEMHTASLLGKAVASDATAISAHTTLEMATLRGARCLGLDSQVGSLEVGKEADVVAVDLSDVRTQPIYHPVSQLVYSASAQQVSDVWVGGRQLLHDRELLTMDLGEVSATAERWCARIGVQDADAVDEPS